MNNMKLNFILYIVCGALIGVAVGAYELSNLNVTDFVAAGIDTTDLKLITFTKGLIQGFSLYVFSTLAIFGVVGLITSVIIKDCKDSFVASLFSGIFLATVTEPLIRAITVKHSDGVPTSVSEFMSNQAQAIQKLPMEILKSLGIIFLCVLTVKLLRKVPFTKK